TATVRGMNPCARTTGGLQCYETRTPCSSGPLNRVSLELHHERFECPYKTPRCTFRRLRGYLWLRRHIPLTQLPRRLLLCGAELAQIHRVRLVRLFSDRAEQ